MNELMRSEILDQPEALNTSLERLRQQLISLSVPLGSKERIILSGSGDSYFAPLSLAYAARQNGLTHAHILSALEAAEFWPFTPQDLLVAISVSGKAAQTVRAAQAASKQNASVLAVTVNDDSPLAILSTYILKLPFKSRSRQTPHTTDYLTTLLALAAFIETFSQKRFEVLDRLSDFVAKTISETEKPCQEIAQSLKEKEKFYFLGGGPGFATGLYAAAKFWEAGGIQAAAFDLEELAHGPHLMMDAGDPVIIIAPRGKSLSRAREIVDGLHDLQVEIFVVTDAVADFPGIRTIVVPELAEEWSPFVTSVPLQWLCLEISNAKRYDVLTKDGRHANAAAYEAAHRHWVSAASG